MTERLVSDALVMQFFPPRRYFVVPNVSYGWGLSYEADVIAISPSGWASEVEVKTSAADLKADCLKAKHRRISLRIRNMWYCVPEDSVTLALDPAYVGLECGVMTWRFDVIRDKISCCVMRKPKANPAALKCTPQQIQDLLRLGTLRYWDLRIKS